MKKPTYSLKQAQADPKAMSQFISEHEDLEVEGERFEAVMGSMSQGKPKVAQEASVKAADDDYT